MASSKYVAEKLDDLTECPICTDTLKEPRMLPCMHNFCLQCLLLCSKDKPSGSVFRCPVCRNNSTIPQGGFKTLPINFFVENIVELHKVSGAVSHQGGREDLAPSLCEICSNSGRSSALKMNPKGKINSQNGDHITQATRYCVDCHQKLCDKCTDVHRMMKLTANHKLLPLGVNSKDDSTNEADKTGVKKKGIACEQHQDKRLTLYCVVCRRLICSVCASAGQHRTHTCMELTVATKKSSKIIKRDVKQVADCAAEYNRKLKNLQKEVSRFKGDIEKAKQDICRKSEELKKSIDRNTSKLLQELDLLESSKMKEVTEVQSNLEMTLSMFESVRRFGTEVLNRGGSTDVVRMSNDIHNQASDLFRLPVQNLEISLVYFKPSDRVQKLMQLTANNLIGDIKVVEDTSIKDKFRVYLTTPVQLGLVPQMAGKGCVEGLAVLDDELYTIRSGVPDIQVCDVNNMQTKRRIPISGQQPQDLTVCNRSRSLYVCDWITHSVYRVRTPEGPVVSTWKMKDKPGGLSVNHVTGNILIAGHGTNQLLEYTPEGQLLRTVQLQQDFDKPWHAFHISGTTEYFLACRWHRLCLVDLSGRVIQTHGAVTRGPGFGQLDHPSHLALDSTGLILVADCNNNRIKLLGNELQEGFERDLVTRDHGLNSPHRIHLDNSNGRLYIGMGDGRLAAYRVFI